MGIPPFHGTGEFFPGGFWSKSFEVLKGSAIASYLRGTQDTAKIEECFLIDLILAKQVRVIGEIPQEPTEFPQRSLRAIEPAG
jgi:hypothetical protein